MLIFKKLKSFYLPFKRDFIWSMLFMLIAAGITVVYLVYFMAHYEPRLYD